MRSRVFLSGPKRPVATRSLPSRVFQRISSARSNVFLALLLPRSQAHNVLSGRTTVNGTAACKRNLRPNDVFTHLAERFLQQTGSQTRKALDSVCLGGYFDGSKYEL